MDEVAGDGPDHLTDNGGFIQGWDNRHNAHRGVLCCHLCVLRAAEQKPPEARLAFGASCEPLMQEQIHTHAAAGMAVRKDEMWDDEERPDPVPLAWDRVTAEGNVELPQGPAKAAQDGA